MQAAKAELAGEDRLVTALVGEGASADTRTKFRRMLRAGELEDKEVELALTEPAGLPIGAWSTCRACRRPRWPTSAR